MLLGVGPKKELETHGIDVIVDNSHAGQHLIDHSNMPFVLRIQNGFSMDDHLLCKGLSHDASVEQYKKRLEGPVAFGLLVLVGSLSIDKYYEANQHYRQVKKASGEKDLFSPERQYHFEIDFFGMFGRAFQWHYQISRRRAYISVMVDLVCPVSEQGEVTLNSADTLIQPKINLNFLADELDIVAFERVLGSATTF